MRRSFMPMTLPPATPMRSSGRLLSMRSQAARLAGCASGQLRLDPPRDRSHSDASCGSAVSQSSYCVRPVTPSR